MVSTKVEFYDGKEFLAFLQTLKIGISAQVSDFEFPTLKDGYSIEIHLNI